MSHAMIKKSYEVHSLKTWPEFFDAVADGRKTFEVRRDDRAFRVGDIVTLLRWEPEHQAFTTVMGQPVKLSRRVTYILVGGDAGPGLFGIEMGYVVLGLGPVESAP